jgi:predicted amidophosphoribosyltransferase
LKLVIQRGATGIGMHNVNPGKTFQAGMGLALGLVMAGSVYSFMNCRESVIRHVILCPRCGNKNSDGNKFCNECGRPLYPPPQVTCPKCAATVAALKFCGACGTLLQRQRKR